MKHLLAIKADEIAYGDWHRQPYEATARTLRTDAAVGLSFEEAASRLARFGPNQLPEQDKRSPLRIFISQFNDFIVWVLVAAAAISGLLLREFVDSAAIAAILLLNAVLGFVQELRAEAAMESLKKMSAPKATAIRDGREVKLPANDLVPGDLIVLTAGDVVPADCRLIEAAKLQIDESALTGESVAVHKSIEAIDLERVPLGDRKNMAYLGTVVQAGRGKGVVVATGSSTEMGQIASLIESREEPTPLQVELKRVGRAIAVMILAICLAIFASGVATGKPPIFMFLVAVSLAVAAIPEGLPAIVTVTLALGVQAMASAKAIVRRLHAVEALGATTFIATDKTGTLTENRMAVGVLHVDGRTVELDKLEEGPTDKILHIMRASILASDAHRSGERITGDPTEVALLKASENLGLDKEREEASLPRVDEVPFDSSRKFMTTLHFDGSGFIAFSKGAPEILLEICSLSNEERRAEIDAANRLATAGYRALAVAERRFEERPPELESAERDLSYLGLIALLDPPRPEAAAAVEACRAAGIRVAMVTGDHAATALAIAKQIGLDRDSRVLTGADLEEMSVEELSEAVSNVSIFARVDPSHKLKIVEALKASGERVAMTGDGVNDAPALKKADVGVAMGEIGTEVAKEASDIVLADDNFATIVSAVRQGRLIFDNLRKFIHFLLSCNVSEVLTMFAATIVGMPVPLFPVQLLWINLVTDGLPAIALGVDPPEKDLMMRRPRGANEAIVAPAALKKIFSWGIIMTLGSLGVFLGVLLLRGVPPLDASDARYYGDLRIAQTATFTAMVFLQLLHSLNFRSSRESLFSRWTFGNRYLLASIALSAALQLASVYVPAAQRVFRTAPLGTVEWMVIAMGIALPILVIDFTKRIAARRLAS